ncbi:MAG: SET domain-containing protein [Ginsengibacter sp.]
MAFLEKQLHIKSSTLPGAGNGLFTTTDIKKGTRIIEYKGKVTTWKEVVNAGTFNAYVYYIKRDHVIDAKNYMKAVARYANDARGLTRKKGINNNTTYVQEEGRVYIEATKNIKAGEEILVAYGRDYWDVIRSNMQIDEEAK